MHPSVCPHAAPARILQSSHGYGHSFRCLLEPQSGRSTVNSYRTSILWLLELLVPVCSELRSSNAAAAGPSSCHKTAAISLPRPPSRLLQLQQLLLPDFLLIPQENHGYLQLLKCFAHTQLLPFLYFIKHSDGTFHPLRQLLMLLLFLLCVTFPCCCTNPHFHLFHMHLLLR
eukprot:TRINITY_DN8178_c0_g1_i2.p2 TRINITY_DN8178_c0_g1~~TRINITY_DN8178_c0_g1_i2.p2  ORF type:complete len:172 (+),score=41.05 TRINITY_DN8178_c0_g1_i2:144-659(+)